MGMNLQKLKKEQLKLAKRTIVEDRFSEINKVAGCDQAFFGDKVISAAVVCDYRSMDIIERKYSIIKEPLPYIPGYLSYREGPAIIKAFRKLNHKPDLLLIDGNGILHRHRIGLASHVGVNLEIPTIGIAKNLLLGEIKNKKIQVENEIRAHILHTRPGCKPLYISPGHKISLESCIKIVNNCLRGHKLPEPLRQAHLHANKAKSEYENLGT